MPKGRKSRRSNKKRPYRRSNVQNRELIRIQQTQQNYMVPRIPDAMPIHVRRGHVYTVEKTCYQVLSGSTAYCLQFSLQALADASAYAEVFDRYRIAQVQISFQNWLVSATTPVQLPIVTAIDLNPSSTTRAGTFTGSDLLEYDTVQVVSVAPGVGTTSGFQAPYFQRVFAPAVTTLAAQTGSTAVAAFGGISHAFVSTDTSNQVPWSSLLIAGLATTAPPGFFTEAQLIITYVINFMSSV